MGKLYTIHGSGQPSHQDLLERIRIAVAWFEWSEPPDVTAAQALQAAADGLRDGKLGADAARLVLERYRARALDGGAL